MTSLRSCPTCGSELASDAPGGLCPNCLLSQGLDAAPPNSRVSPTTLRPMGFTPLSPASLAAEFPQLEILELLGYGGMGAVYKARQTKLDRMVALKIIRPESAADPEFAERFNREARTLARVTHPHIVGIHDFGEIPARGERTAPLFFFIMEYVDGANLRSLIEAGNLQPSVALAIVPQICDALQYAHDEGVIHRDIKPENILLDQRGRVKIADFGLAKLAGTASDFSLTGTHQVMGTLRYMAPEQMEGSRSVDHRADIFSLGVVFYELLTGQVPAGHFDPPSQRVGIDPRLDSVVLRALAREPSKRFQNASDVRREIDALSSSAGLVTSAPRPEHQGGFSTLIDREVLGAWRWATGAAVTEAHTPSYPGTWMILLCLAAGLSILFPWITLHVDKGLDLRNSWNSGFVAEDTARVVYGQETISGVIMAVILAILMLVLVMTPTTRAISSLRGLMFILLSAGALLAAGIFVYEARSEVRVIVPIVNSPDRSWDATTDAVGVPPVSVPAVKAPEQSDGTHDHGASGGSSGGSSESVDPYRGDSASITVARLPHRVTYHFGYYAAFGSLVPLLLLSGLSTRRAAAQTDEPRRAPASAAGRPGTPVASYRFLIDDASDLATRAAFHFSPLGYSLVEQGPDALVFRRGGYWGGLLETDVRKLQTDLTIRTASVSGGAVWVNCDWSLITWGSWIMKRDVAKLEAEGRDFEAFLTARFRPDANPQNTPAPHAASDLALVQGEVDVPSLVLMLVGALTFVGHWVAFVRFVETQSELSVWMCVPGIPAGFVMFLGGWYLRRVRSPGWVRIGAIAALVPVSPIWIFSAPIGIWVLNVLGRTHVRRTMAERTYSSGPDAPRTVESAPGNPASQPAADLPTLSPAASDLALVQAEVDVPSLALMVVGALMTISHGVGFSMFMENRLSDEFAWLWTPGIAAGSVMFLGGWYLRRVRSPGLVKIGAIAALLPVSPGWLITVAIGIWALIVLGRPHVSRTMAERTYSSGPDASRTVEPAAAPANRTHPELAELSPARRELALVRAEVDPPGLVLIAFGVLMMIGHSLVFGVMMDNPRMRDGVAWLCYPGIVVGFLMCVAGWRLRSVRSPAWVKLGAIAALLPTGPGWIITVAIGIWVLKVLDRPDVKRMMAERTYADV